MWKMARTKKSTQRSALKSKRKQREQIKKSWQLRKAAALVRNAPQLAEQVDAAPSTSTSSASSLCPKTQSQFKVDSYAKLVAGSNDKCATSTKRAVVDLSAVGSLISTLCCPVCHTNSLCFNADSKPHQGLAVYGQVVCSTCQETISEQYLAERSESKVKVFDINRQAVYASLMTGLGSTLNKFCESMDISGMHHKSFQSHANKMYEKLEQYRKHVFGETVTLVREAHAKLRGLVREDSDILDIGVSYDGTWLTRGHSSLIGVGCVIDLLTGLCIDAHVMCTYCHVCQTTGSKMQLENPEEYAVWEKNHKADCENNFTGM